MKNSTVVYAYRIAILSLVILVAGSSATWAQNQKGAEIRDKLEKVVTDMGTLTANLDRMCPADCQSKEAGKMFKAKVERVKAAHERLSKAHGRTTVVDFQETLRKRRKGKSEACDPEVQVCTAATTSGFAVQASATTEFDEEAGTDMVTDLTEVDGSINELNAILESDALKPVDPDFQLAEAEFFFPTSMRPSDKAEFAAFLAQLVAVKAVAIGTHLCDQTAVALGFGGNGAAVCAVSEGIAQVVGGVYETMDFMSNSFQGAEITAIYKRTKNIFDQAAKTDSIVDGLKEKVDAMALKLLQIEKNQQYIIQLLNMPAGQRPAFPKP